MRLGETLLKPVADVRRPQRWRSVPCVAMIALLGLAGLSACSAQARSGSAEEVPAATAAEPAAPPTSKRTINLDQLRLSYIADFNGPFSVSSWGCVTDWIAHTPWRGDFGDAVFADPTADFPFSVQGGALAIEARKFDDGRWRSGMLSSRDVCNSGWSQLYGYFEIRAKLPDAPGFWPAFWLIGVNPNANTGTSEIDVFEYYSARPGSFSMGVIKHPGLVDTNKRVSGYQHEVAPGTLTENFNIYGVEIDPKETTFYFNREEVFSIPTEAEFRQPFYPLVSMAVIANDVTAETPPSVRMEVDYIRVYQREIN